MLINVTAFYPVAYYLDDGRIYQDEWGLMGSGHLLPRADGVNISIIKGAAIEAAPFISNAISFRYPSVVGYTSRASYSACGANDATDARAVPSGNPRTA